LSLGSKKPRDQGIIGIFHYSGLIVGYEKKILVGLHAIPIYNWF
jgi:hypothetical protein